MKLRRSEEIKLADASALIKEVEVKFKLGTLGENAEQQRANTLRILTKALRPVDAGLAAFITNDPAMLAMKDRMRLLYERPEPVMITGPTGTGKELLAKALRRPGHPFIAENCAAIPESLVESVFFGHMKGAFTGATSDRIGLLEEAKEGVIFLDEIGDMPLSLQAKFLRAIQENEIRRVGGTQTIALDCRFVAATKYDLEDRVAKGLFREDLFARLMTFEINVTGLVDRPYDIIPITQSLIADPRKFGTGMSVHDGGMPDYPESVLKRIYRFNVRAIETALARWRAYGNYE